MSGLREPGRAGPIILDAMSKLRAALMRSELGCQSTRKQLSTCIVSYDHVRPLSTSSSYPSRISWLEKILEAFVTMWPMVGSLFGGVAMGPFERRYRPEYASELEEIADGDLESAEALASTNRGRPENVLCRGCLIVSILRLGSKEPSIFMSRIDTVVRKPGGHP